MPKAPPKSGDHAPLNKQWKATCRILFGAEIGELSEFAPYLKETMFPCKMFKSALSGKPVMVSSPHYPDAGKYASQEEIAKMQSLPLSINDIKDIDSLFGAASERVVFCGNKLFGKNVNVKEGDNIADCLEVLHSHDIYNSKYVAYSSIGRVSDSIYGVNIFWKCSHAIRCSECTVAGAQRCFECYYSTGIADSYFTFNCSSCQDCMFSFNLRGKNCMIGNLQLTKERYRQLKAKLVSEMAEKLQKDKRLFSIGDIARLSFEQGKSEALELPPSAVPIEVEGAFAATSRIVLGKQHNSGRLAKWLMSRAIGMKKVRGAQGSPAFKSDSPTGRLVGSGRLVSFNEALASSANSISISESELPSLDEIKKRAAQKAAFSLELLEGQNRGVCDTLLAFNSSDVYRLWWSVLSKHSAYSTVVTESEHIFGGWGRNIFSQFCINCDNLTYASKCFETDSSYQCRNCYFCHNCEDVEEGILCFNVKGMRYAVLNQQVTKEEYARIKKMLLDYINKELDAKGKLEIDIFSIGAGKKKKEKK
ncbi:MAG: hypothetical protein NTV88_03485 [Candidatus Micrarchaeota archaeon]|nr:hypothetical protein [Candidatus Micrarchaeota archaeon]